LGKEICSVLENKVSMILNSMSFEAVNTVEMLCVGSQISEADNPNNDSRKKYKSDTGNLLLHGKLHEVDKIITFRQIYSNIYDATQLVNSVYGFLLLLLFVRAAGGLITNIYHLVSITLSGEDVLDIENWSSATHIGSLVVWILIFLSTIIVMTVTCQMAVLESKKLDDVIQKLLLQQSLRYDMLQQLKLFSDQITKNQIEFSALRFFKVDMSLLFTILTSVTSYIIVLVQFK
jgi:gustatory receptor